MDVHEKLDELVSLVENSRSMPMSASCIVNRGEVLALLDELRDLLPEEFRHAELLLADRDAVVAEGRAEAQRILDDARAERDRLVSETEVYREADRAATEVRERARDEAEAHLAEVDHYIDGKLANFEVVLNRTLAAVERGRAKLAGHRELDDLAALQDEVPLPGG